MTNKKQKALLGLAVVFLLTAGFTRAMKDREQSRWKELSWEQGRFSVVLPDNPNSPEYLDSELEIPGRPLKVPAHAVVGYDGDVQYTVHYCDLPRGARKTYLEDKRREVMRRGKGRFSYRVISLGSNSGIEFRLRSKKAFSISRHYLVGDRLFILTVTNEKRSEMPEDLERFFGSFKIAST